MKSVVSLTFVLLVLLSFDPLHLCFTSLCARLIALTFLRVNSGVMYWIAYSIVCTDSFLQDEVQMCFYSIEYKRASCVSCSLSAQYDWELGLHRWLRGLRTLALLENLNSVSDTHAWRLIVICNSDPKAFDTIFWPGGILFVCFCYLRKQQATNKC